MHLFINVCTPEGHRRRHYKKQGLVWLSNTVQVVLPLSQNYLRAVVRWAMDASAEYTKGCVHKKLFLAPTLSRAEEWIQRGASFKGWGLRHAEMNALVAPFMVTQSPSILSERSLTKTLLHVLDKMSSTHYSFAWVLSVQSH